MTPNPRYSLIINGESLNNIIEFTYELVRKVEPISVFPYAPHEMLLQREECRCIVRRRIFEINKGKFQVSEVEEVYIGYEYETLRNRYNDIYLFLRDAILIERKLLI